MVGQLIVPFGVAAIVVVGYVALDAWTRRTAHLKLGLFHPYRGDAWPSGVQEDDDFRFRWTPPADPADVPDPSPFEGDPGAATIEDLLGRHDVAERVEHVSTRAGEAFRH